LQSQFSSLKPTGPTAKSQGAFPRKVISHSTPLPAAEDYALDETLDEN